MDCKTTGLGGKLARDPGSSQKVRAVCRPVCPPSSLPPRAGLPTEREGVMCLRAPMQPGSPWQPPYSRWDLRSLVPPWEQHWALLQPALPQWPHGVSEQVLWRDERKRCGLTLVGCQACPVHPGTLWPHARHMLVHCAASYLGVVVLCGSH